jgi:SET domain-containing protein
MHTRTCTRAPTNSMYLKILMKQARSHSVTPPQPAAAAATAPGGRRIQVRQSGVHGKGVFAAVPLAKGETIIEYKGEIISWPEALRRHPHDPSDPNHTFYFHIDDGRVIDAKFGGNTARWINHACTPNCQAEQAGDQVFIQARRAIKAGEELFYDYGLVIDERYTPKLKKQFECRCGTPKCRGTMLAPKR